MNLLSHYSFAIDCVLLLYAFCTSIPILCENKHREKIRQKENNKGRKEKSSAHKVNVSDKKLCLQQIVKWLAIRYAVSKTESEYLRTHEDAELFSRPICAFLFVEHYSSFYFYFNWLTVNNFLHASRNANFCAD